MKVKRSAAVSLLVALGAAMAGKWAPAKLLGRLKKIDELVDDDTKLDEDDAAVLAKIRKANEAEEDLDIVDDEGEKPTKKGSKKATKAEADDEDEKPKKKGKAPKKAKSEGPGVIASIVEFLKGASSKSPISKAEILEKLVERFPERGEDAMKSTINIQVPSRLTKDKGLVIKKNENGYFIPRGAKAETNGEAASAKKVKAAAKDEEEDEGDEE